MSRYHTIYSMSVQACQEMLMSNDYILICNESKPLLKRSAKKAYNKFIEELRELFGGDGELSKLIDKDVLIQGMRIKKVLLINLKEGLLDCYYRKDVGNKVRRLDSLKKTYRKVYFDYPKRVDPEADAETQKKQIDSIIKPIEGEITRLDYKIKEHSPVAVIHNKDEKQTGLTLHMMFIEAVYPEKGYLDQRMSVHDMSIRYMDAVSKNNKLKAQS